MKYIAIFGSIIWIIITVMLYRCTASEYSHSYYSTYSSVTFDRGWIPKWLPKTAYDIEEAHNLDTNESWLTFKYSPEDKYYIAECKKKHKDELLWPNFNNVYSHFYPDFVSHMNDVIRNNETMVYFLCGYDPHEIIPVARYVYLALDNQNNTAYVWSIDR